MKKKVLVSIFVLIAFSFAGAFACDECDKRKWIKSPTITVNADVDNTNLNKNTNLNLNKQGQFQGQKQKQNQNQNQTAYGGHGGDGGDASSSSYTGDNTLTNDISYNNTSIEKTRFAAINPTHVTVGEVSKPVAQFYLQGQTEEDDFTGDRSNAIQAGVTIPITWKTGVNKSLMTEQQRLIDRNLHAREKHQAEMASMCMALHKYIISTGAALSPELWNRCAGFEHPNNESINSLMEQIPPKGRHNLEQNPRQLSPHSEPYHK